MNIENTQSQMRKGVLEYCILSVIRKKEAYPGDIIESMKNAGIQLLEGTLYPLLNRLKNGGILSYHWVESTSGPPRKYFRLTEKGETFYNMLAETWNELATGVERITSEEQDDLSSSETGASSEETGESSSSSDSLSSEQDDFSTEEQNTF